MRISDWSSDVCSSDLGTNGWPETAPFDAILVSAGGPAVPGPLRSQLKIGGRLVIPIGSADAQRLVRVTREGEEDYAEEDLGGVRFVPLIGAHGWSNGKHSDDPKAEKKSLSALIADARSEEHTSELQSLMRNSYAVFCLKKKKKQPKTEEHKH